MRKADDSSNKRTISRLLLFPFLLIALTSLLACSKNDPGKKMQRPPAPVSVAAATQRNVPFQLSAVGNVEAISSVQVKAQQGGVLDKVHFREGQDVAKSAPLFTIDPRPYEAQVKQAEANLSRDKAQLENAREETRRYGELVGKGYVAKEQYDQFRTNAAALEAVVNADNAMLENARLQLKYCYIYSPISGRAGNLNVTQGNLIKANADTSMVVINQMEPIYVTFSLPEKYLSEIKRYYSSGKLKVAAYLSKEDKDPEHGTVTFIDNTVDPSTGTIKIKGSFVNHNRRLWPGQFVNAVITLYEIPDAIVVPSAAIQTGQDGQFLYIVSKDGTVESRPVVTGISVDDGTVIDKGVSKGETVVTDGQLQLIPGAKVEIKTKTGAENPAPAAGVKK